MAIDTEAKLKLHLKLMKKQLLKNGCQELALYPTFCAYYYNNMGKYPLPKIQVLNIACEVLVEEGI